MVLWYAHMVSLISSQYCRGTRGGALSGFSVVGMKWQTRSVKPEVVWKRSLYLPLVPGCLSFGIQGVECLSISEKRVLNTQRLLLLPIACVSPTTAPTLVHDVATFPLE